MVNAVWGSKEQQDHDATALRACFDPILGLAHGADPLRILVVPSPERSALAVTCCVLKGVDWRAPLYFQGVRLVTDEEARMLADGG